MNFIALDFETANSSRASICSIGLVRVKNGVIREEIHTYINPQDKFTAFNTEIHGITEDMVQDAPTFEAYWPTFKAIIENETLIAHNASFDMSALRYALNTFDEPYAEFTYGCSYVFAKKVWPSLYNYRLSTVANYLGIKFRHHDALEDARAAALVTLAALDRCEVESLQDLSDMHNLQLGVQHSNSHTPAGIKKNKRTVKLAAPKLNQSHPFYHADVVFTGKLKTMSRGQASQKVINCGGHCKNSVTKSTNYVVIGEDNVTSFTELFSSTKMHKAEELINKGYPINIIGERDFLSMLEEG